MKQYLRVGFFILCILYGADLLLQYRSLDLNYSFGYLDLQAHWQSVQDLWEGKVIYRDFFWEYGIFMLLIRLPIHLLLGKTFFSNLINGYFFLPLLGIGLSIIIGRQYLKSKGLLIFLFLLLLFKTNNDYNAIRHLIPELGLILAALGVVQDNRTKRITGSILLGISLISSPEYAIIGSVSFAVFFIAHLFVSQSKTRIRDAAQTIVIPALTAFVYGWYLLLHGVGRTFLTFHTEQMSAFYTDSPCREVFPRLVSLGAIFSRDASFIENVFYFMYRLNVYGIFVIIIGLFIWNAIHRKNKYALVNAVLLLFSFGAYGRTINTPCYLNYGVTFVILLVSQIATQKDVSKKVRNAAYVILVFFFFASGFFDRIATQIRQLSVLKPVVEKEYLPVAGLYLDNTVVQDYKYIVDYVTSRTTEKDFVYVYPDGPYNQLMRRKSPVPAFSTLYYGLSPSILPLYYERLVAQTPSYIIINTHNSSSYVSAVRGVAYNIHQMGSRVLFEGLTTSVEEYISGNYEIEETRKLAWILKKSETELPPLTLYEEDASLTNWGIQTDGIERIINADGGNTASFQVKKIPFSLVLTHDFEGISHVVLPIKIELGIIKPLSKYTYELFLIVNNTQTYPIRSGFVTADWQDIYVYVPQIQEKGFAITGFALKINSNQGFLPLGKPSVMQLTAPRIYRKNPEVIIDMSIIQTP